MVNNFDGFVFIVACGVAIWTWDSSIAPAIEASKEEIMDWIMRDDDDAR